MHRVYIKLQNDVNLMNERFHTDLDDMMACYQTNYSPLGLPPGSENTFENDSRKGINTFMFTTYSQADFFFLVRHNIDLCDPLCNDVPNIDPSGG